MSVLLFPETRGKIPAGQFSVKEDACMGHFIRDALVAIVAGVIVAVVIRLAFSG